MARVNLTAKKLLALKPTPSRVDYFDENLPGFFVRVSPAGRKSFGVLYRVGRHLRRYTIGTAGQWTLADARDHARDVLRAAAKGQDLALEKQAERLADTFSELVEVYLEKHASQKRSGREDRRILSKYFSGLRHHRAKDVTRAQIRAVIEDVAQEAPIMANRCLASVRKMYNWAVSRDLVEHNPCAHLSAPSKERRRDRVLSEDEIRNVWQALDGHTSAVADAFKLRLLTAQRGGEVLGMTWAEVDLETRWWTIPVERSKNKLPHRVWLSDPAVRILKAARKREEAREKARAKRNKRPPRPLEWVFPGRRPSQPIREAKRVLDALREASGVDDWTGHDLRRTAATYMTAMGITRLTVGRILNHAEPGVTAIYDRASYDAEKKKALDAWARRLMGIVSNAKEGRESASMP